MKVGSVFRSAVSGLFFGFWAALSLTVVAAEVTPEMASRAVTRWRATRSAMDCTFGKRVASSRRCEADGAKFNVVKIEDGGFVVTSADTAIRPIVFFSDGEDVDEDPNNPLFALLKADMKGAAEAATNRTSKGGAQLSAARLSAIAADVAKNESDWAELLDERPVRKLSATVSPSDVRVEPLVPTRWNQDRNVWNYYTPSNYVCGCVATAMSQIMRTLRHPTASRAQFTNPYCSVNGTDMSFTSMGGTYDWDNMPTTASSSTALAKRQAIGKLAYDAGVSVSMDWGKSGSGTGTYIAGWALINRFGYRGALVAQWSDGNSDSSKERTQRAMMTNFDAGLPVQLAVAGDGGHSIVGDGYGYVDGKFCCHVNMGWSGSYDGYYIPPDIDDFNVIRTVVYNIFATQDPACAIVSGRVITSNGSAASGITVTAKKNNTTSGTTTTNSKGIFSFYLLPGSTYTIKAVTANGDYEVSTNATPNAVKTTSIVISNGNPTGSYWSYNSDVCNVHVGDMKLGLPAVATIGDAGYTTIADAVTAAQAGDTIKLVKDVTENPSLTKACTLDFNGHTLTGTVYCPFDATDGTVTLKNGTITGASDSFDGQAGNTATFPNGKVTFENMTMNGVIWSDSHPLTFNGGTYTGTINAGAQNCMINSGNFASLTKDSTGVFMVKGGRFANDVSSVSSIPVRTQWVNDGTATYPWTLASVVRTMSVTAMNENDHTVTLAFGSPDNCAYTLYVAYGATDGGDDKSHWTSSASVGTVAVDDTSKTITLPSDLVSSKVVYRFFLVDENGNITVVVSPLFATQESFAITEFTESTLKLRLAATAPRSLYLASGATDGGDDKYAWDSFDKLGDLALGQTNFTCTLPSRKRFNRYARLFLLRNTELDNDESRPGSVRAMSVTFPSGVLIDFNEHIDQQTVIVPGGITWESSTFAVVASRLEKRAAGMLVVDTDIHHVPSITVAGGVFKLNGTVMDARNTVTVREGGALDMNGKANNPCYVQLEGTGPDGLGALRNTGGDLASDKAQLTGLTLLNDALVKSSSDFGLIARDYGATKLELNGHTLSLDYPDGKRFWMANLDSNTQGTIFIKSGWLQCRNNSYEVKLSNVKVVVDGTTSKFEVPSSGQAKKITLNDVTLQNGGMYYNGQNVVYLQNFTMLDSATITGGVKWIYVAKNVVVSNETSGITLNPPIAGNSTYAKLWKYGSGTFTIADNHTDQRMHSGAEVLGGLVVMDSTAKPPHENRAISSQAVPMIIHDGATIDMRKCTNAVLITQLWLTPGGTDANNRPLGNIWSDPAKTQITVSDLITIDVAPLFASVHAPAQNTVTTLLEAKTLSYTSGRPVMVTGCPYPCVARVKSNKLLLDTTVTRAASADYAWSPDAGNTDFWLAGSWKNGNTACTNVDYTTLRIPDGVSVTPTYKNYDNVTHWATKFLIDGTLSLCEVGGFYNDTFDIGPNGKLIIDPTRFCWYLRSPPIFRAGSKLALAAPYANCTNGRFLICYWDNGEVDLDAANAAFDTSSAQGLNPRLTADQTPDGKGRLWLDLDADHAEPRMNILCVGDSITQGDYNTYGNWRVPLMKKLCAAGYAPWTKGFWSIESQDINGVLVNDAWNHHAGVSAQRLVTSSGAGTEDSIEATLDQAGNVDFVLIKLGTNDININGSTANELYPHWTNLVWKVLNQKPHAKVIVGAVVDIAYNADKDALVQAFNARMRNAINGGTFPAKRVYFADLYTACYRYTGNGDNRTYIDHMFYTETNLHPDWYGEDRLAEAYLATVKTALAEAESGWTLNAAEMVPATSGAEANVPSAFREGYARARIFDVAKHSGWTLTTNGAVPYEDYYNLMAAESDLSRVGYYVELKRKNDSQTDYHGLTRWLWVSMDAFNDRTIDTVGVPLPTRAITQGKATNLRIASNMPGIESTAANATGVEGWIEFWPSSYGTAASGVTDEPAHLYGYDWNDKRSTGNYGSMQVHRVTLDGNNPAQVLFAFNRWTSTGNYEIGLGNFAHQKLNSIDWTFSGDASKNLSATMSAAAYEVARIEIWTMVPSAAGAAVDVDSVTIDGTTATVNLNLLSLGTDATRAMVTLQWSEDPNFETITGSSNLGMMTVTGAMSANVTGLEPGKMMYFRATTQNNLGQTASDTSDPYAVPANVWRPATASDTWASSAWKSHDLATAHLFMSNIETLFDGTEATKVASVNVDASVTTPLVTVKGSFDYTFTGTGAITAPMLVKDGTGKLTIDSGAFSGVQDIVISNGVFQLGANAAQGAVGANGGKVTIAAGGQLDVNATDASSGLDSARSQITSGKTYYIAGAGPDGLGALVDNAGKNLWNNRIQDVHLTADATIGGTSRIDFRTASKGIHGATNLTLTIANTGSSGSWPDPGMCGVNVLRILDVGKVVVTNGAALTFEDKNFNVHVPYGIELYGLLGLYKANGTWSDIGPGVTVKGSGAKILAANNNTTTLPVPITVTSGSTLTLLGNSNNEVDYTGAITNAGTITATSGKHKVLAASTIVNVGNPLFTQAVESWNNASKVIGDSRLNVTAEKYWMGAGQDYGESALAVSLSGSGSLVLGQTGVNKGLPKFAPGKFTVQASDDHTGSIFYAHSASSSINGPRVTGTVREFCARGPISSAIIKGCASNVVVSATSFNVGTQYGYCDWRFEGGETAIHAMTNTIGCKAEKLYQGSLTIAEGLLGLGAGGLTTSWRMPTWQQFTMANGTLKADADFAITAPGMTASFGTPKHEGAVTIDLNGHTLNWATGLNGASDVTITGNGTFTGGRRGIQGIPTGKWTVESTGSIGLENAAGFAGGLELKSGVTVNLGITGESLVEMIATTWSGNAWNPMRPILTNDTVRFCAPHVATSLEWFHAPKSQITDVKHGTGSGFMAVGEFYVSTAQAGTWWFANRSTSYSGLFVDDVLVSEKSPGTGETKSVSLTAGWHRFAVSFYTNADNPTIGPQDAYPGASHWFRASSAKGNWPQDYTPFDTTTVPMRMRTDQARTSVVWRRSTDSTGTASDAYQDLGDEKFTSVHCVTNSLRQLHGYNLDIEKSSVHDYAGYFYVAPEKGNKDWWFRGQYDDRLTLHIDGTKLFSTTAASKAATATVPNMAPGWHRFEIRVTDNGGNAGAKLKDSTNNVAALLFSVDGGTTTYVFDERNLNIAMKPGEAQKCEKPGLGGVIKLAANATLVNTPARAGGYCPIYGTLKGTGNLSGAFRFTGTDNVWEMTGNATELAKVDTTGVTDANFLKGLKKVKVAFSAKPTKVRYQIGSARGLTNAEAESIAVEITGEGFKTQGWKLAVVNGQLYLKNINLLHGPVVVFR